MMSNTSPDPTFESLRRADNDVAVSRAAFGMLRKSLMDTYADLDRFPGTERGLERVLEALRTIEEAIDTNQRNVDESIEEAMA